MTQFLKRAVSRKYSKIWFRFTSEIKVEQENYHNEITPCTWSGSLKIVDSEFSNCCSNMYNDEKSNHHHHSIFQSLLASWYKDLTSAHNILKLWRIFNIVGTFERLFFKISNIVKFSFIDHSHKIELRVLREKSLQNFFWNVQVFFYIVWTFLDFQVLYYCCCQVWLGNGKPYFKFYILKLFLLWPIRTRLNFGV